MRQAFVVVFEEPRAVLALAKTYITAALSWPVSSTRLEKKSTFLMQTEELQEMQAEWKQEYRVRRADAHRACKGVQMLSFRLRAQVAAPLTCTMLQQTISPTMTPLPGRVWKGMLCAGADPELHVGRQA